MRCALLLGQMHHLKGRSRVRLIILLVGCYQAQRGWAELPPLSPEYETLVLGPSTSSLAAVSRGRWMLDRGELEIGRWGFWLVGGEDAELEDGTVRVRLSVGHRPELILAVRARLDRRRQRIDSGHALMIQDRLAWFARIRRGVPIRIGRRYRLGRLKGDRSIEVLLLMLGKRIVASIRQYPSGRLLGMLHTELATVPAGRIGLLALHRRRQPAYLTLLSTRKACANLPAWQKDRGPHLVALLPDSEAERAARYGSEAERAARYGVELERLAGPPSLVASHTNMVGLEHLVCDAGAPHQIITDLPYKYIDHDFLKQRNQPPVATKTGFRIDRGYKNPEMVEMLLRGWHQRYPRTTLLKTIGHSRQGRPILALGIGQGIRGHHRRPSMLLNGAHHGDELLSVELVLDAIQTLLEGSDTDARVQRWLKELTLWCVPVVNPDGLTAYLEVSARAGRKNGYGLTGMQPQRTDRGVDLNRNYPFRWGASGERASRSRRSSRYYRGPHEASEPETQAMMALASSERFVAAISFHTGTVAILAPYTIDGVKNPQPNEAWIVAQQLAQAQGVHPSQESFEVKRQIYPVEGTDQDWLRHTHGTVALLVEGSSWSPREADNRREVIEAVRPLWTGLLDRYLDGPSICGHVADANGRPVHAEVRIREIQTLANERWSTRCRDGRFDRFLPRPGRYHVDVTAPGLPPLSRAVWVGQKKVHLWIKLPGIADETARCSP